MHWSSDAADAMFRVVATAADEASAHGAHPFSQAILPPLAGKLRASRPCMLASGAILPIVGPDSKFSAQLCPSQSMLAVEVQMDIQDGIRDAEYTDPPLPSIVLSPTCRCLGFVRKSVPQAGFFVRLQAANLSQAKAISPLQLPRHCLRWGD